MWKSRFESRRGEKFNVPSYGKQRKCAPFYEFSIWKKTCQNILKNREKVAVIILKKYLALWSSLHPLQAQILWFSLGHFIRLGIIPLLLFTFLFIFNLADFDHLSCECPLITLQCLGLVSTPVCDLLHNPLWTSTVCPTINLCDCRYFCYLQ